ncbi:hypothetical protein [Lactococcus garvieae]|uniref:hypothetical protein n=1 Tax=Lactococcus garvieae TaxID=1363 RepID=UPI00385462D5
MEKIYKGMPNGAEAVDGNFTELDGSVVHKKGDETISGDKKFTDSVIVKDMQVTKIHTASNSIYNGSGLINYIRVGNMVQVNIRSMPSIPVNTRISGVIPVGYRPPVDFYAGTKTGNLIYCYPDGAVGSGTAALASGDGYFSTSWPTMDAVPAD